MTELESKIYNQEIEKLELQSRIEDLLANERKHRVATVETQTEYSYTCATVTTQVETDSVVKTDAGVGTRDLSTADGDSDSSDTDPPEVVQAWMEHMIKILREHKSGGSLIGRGDVTLQENVKRQGAFMNNTVNI